MPPIGLTLLILTGVGPLIAWRKSTLATARQFLLPGRASARTACALVALGVRFSTSGISFACAPSSPRRSRRSSSAARARARARPARPRSAPIGLVAKTQRRYGGYIVHLGVVLMFLGFAGEGFEQRGAVLLRRASTSTVGRFEVPHEALKAHRRRAEADGDRALTLARDGESLVECAGEVVLPRARGEPTTEVAIRRGLCEDLYIVLAGFDLEHGRPRCTSSSTRWSTGSGSASAAGVGTFIALLPERGFAFAPARLPAVRSPRRCVIALLLLLPRRHRARAATSRRRNRSRDAK